MGDRAAFFGCLVMLSTCSSIFITPLYLAKLQVWIGGSASFVSLWAAVMDGAAFFAFPASFVSARWGNRRASLLAATCALVGYALLAFAGQGVAWKVGVFLAALLIGQSNIMCVMLTLEVTSKSFAPSDKGKALGILMTAFALSGGFAQAVFEIFFASTASRQFLFCVGVMQFFVFSSCGMSLPVRSYEECGGTALSSPSQKHLLTASRVHLNYILVACATWVALVVAAPFASASSFLSPIRIGYAIVLPYAACWLGVAALSLRLLLRGAENARAAPLFRELDEDEFENEGGFFQSATGRAALGKQAVVRPSFSFRRREQHAAKVQQLALRTFEGTMENSSAWVAARKIGFWALFFQFAVLVGGGFLVLNNLHTLAAVPAVQTTGGWNPEALLLASSALFTTGNSISRFLLGHLSDVDSSLISSEVLLGGCCIVVSASMGVLLAAQPAAASYPTSLCLSAFLAGFAFGSPWTLVPAIENAWVGALAFARVHSLMMLAALVGVFVFSDALQQLLLQEKLGTPSFNGVWMGMLCLSVMGALATPLTTKGGAMFQVIDHGSAGSLQHTSSPAGRQFLTGPLTRGSSVAHRISRELSGDDESLDSADGLHLSDADSALSEGETLLVPERRTSGHVSYGGFD